MATNTADPAVKADDKSPVIIDLGKHAKKRIKGLRKGTGRLTEKISGCIEELKASGAISANSQPVIVVVREKRRKLTSLIPGL